MVILIKYRVNFLLKVPQTNKLFCPQMYSWANLRQKWVIEQNSETLAVKVMLCFLKLATLLLLATLFDSLYVFSSRNMLHSVPGEAIKVPNGAPVQTLMQSYFFSWHERREKPELERNRNFQIRKKNSGLRSNCLAPEMRNFWSLPTLSFLDFLTELFKLFDRTCIK